MLYEIRRGESKYLKAAVDEENIEKELNEKKACIEELKKESSRFIDLIVAASDFLKRITVEKCSRLKKDVNVWDFIQETLVADRKSVV